MTFVNVDGGVVVVIVTVALKLSVIVSLFTFETSVVSTVVSLDISVLLLLSGIMTVVVVVVSLLSTVVFCIQFEYRASPLLEN